MTTSGQRYTTLGTAAAGVAFVLAALQLFWVSDRSTSLWLLGASAAMTVVFVGLLLMARRRS